MRITSMWRIKNVKSGSHFKNSWWMGTWPHAYTEIRNLPKLDKPMHLRVVKVWKPRIWANPNADGRKKCQPLHLL